LAESRVFETHALLDTHCLANKPRTLPS